LVTGLGIDARQPVGLTPAAYNARSHHMRRIVRHGPACSHRRAEVTTCSQTRDPSAAFEPPGELDVFHERDGGVSPSASKTRRRTKIAWSPVAIRVARDRAFMSVSMRR
jgi:hypothetical protein